MKKIVLTGGGTAGHVTPNLALVPYLKEMGYEIYYIGSYNGMEKNLIEDENIPYYGISTGMLRRYFDFKNFSDPFKVLKGCKQAKDILRELKPDVVFSKGGYVTVPVINAARVNHIPSIIHESDITPGLANKICIPMCTKVCITFPETKKYVPDKKLVFTGSPVRQDLLNGDKEKAKKYLNFRNEKPILLVMGGSQGAKIINDTLRECLENLLPKYNIVHICGKDKMDNMMLSIEGYRQFEYVKEELKDIFAIADLIISRAGANSIWEFKNMCKPNILIPLSRGSRGDQILNAASFEKMGYSCVLREESLDPSKLLNTIDNVYLNRNTYIEKMKKDGNKDSIKEILDVIKQVTK